MSQTEFMPVHKPYIIVHQAAGYGSPRFYTTNCVSQIRVVQRLLAQDMNSSRRKSSQLRFRSARDGPVTTKCAGIPLCARWGPISRPARWVVVARSRGEGLRGDASHPPNSKGWRFPLNGVPEGVRLVGSEVKTWRIEAIRG